MKAVQLSVCSCLRTACGPRRALSVCAGQPAYGSRSVDHGVHRVFPPSLQHVYGCCNEATLCVGASSPRSGVRKCCAVTSDRCAGSEGQKESNRDMTIALVREAIVGT